MANWLKPLIRALGDDGVIDLARQHPRDLDRVISEGADIVLRYRRNPMMSEFRHSAPTPGVTVVRDEQNLSLFLASVVAASVKTMRWERHRFYYPCREVPHIHYTQPWRSLMRGWIEQDIEPLLTHEKDVWIFDGVDWMICEIKMCLR